MFYNPEQAFGGSARMLELIERIYTAAEDSSLWPDVLGRIATAVSGESNLLFAGFPDIRTPDLYASANFTQDAWNAYGGYYASINPIMEECEAKFSPEVPWVSNFAVSDSALEKTEFYNDFFLRFQMHYCLGLRLLVDGLPPAAMSCQRPKQMGEFTPVERLVFATLRPHIQRALQIHHRLSVIEAKALGLETALTAYDHAVAALDCDGKVYFSNQPAMDLLQLADGIKLVKGSLRCVRHDEDTELQQNISCYVSDKNNLPVTNQALLVTRTKSSVPLLLNFLPLNQRIVGYSRPARVLIVITDTTKASSRSELLKAIYAFSPTETRIADLLLQGYDTRVVSDQLRITLDTARFYVKRILSKTGLKRQSDLVRLLSALPSNSRIQL